MPNAPSDLPPCRIPGSKRSEIRDFLDDGCATIRQIARRWFPGGTPETARKKASRWLRKRQRKGKLKFLGTVLLNDSGRPESVLGTLSSGSIEHDTLVTEAEWLIGIRFKRNVRVGKAVADAGFVKDGNKFYVEVDNQSMTSRQLRQKWRLYGAKIDGFVLVICRTKARMKRLMRSIGHLRSAALFTRFARLRSEKIKEKWVDCYGKRASI
jgi:hypothetical protein